jgi:hypothetical protein
MKSQKQNNRKKQSKTKKNQKTRKIREKSPSLKVLPKDSSLYASKRYSGEEVLKYTETNEKKAHDACLLDNLSWFGNNYQVAKSYQTQETKIYEWKIKKNTRLLRMDKANDSFFFSLFLSSQQSLIPTLSISKQQEKKISYQHPYLKMNNNQKAYYDFCFAFGYMTLEQQFEFMKWIKYLIENKILDIKTRTGTSILRKLRIKINYYRVASLNQKQQKYNRLSFYDFDRHSLLNLCKLVHSQDMAGIYQSNDPSFWFPDLIVYKMNIEEIVLFGPHHDLIYDKEIK